MANNMGTANSAGAVPIRSTDVGAGVQVQHLYDGAALLSSVIVVAVGTSTAAPAIAADTVARRWIAVRNTGTVQIEISPVAGFALGAGWPIDPGDTWETNYNGNLYARVAAATGTSEIRAWSEA